ncbi:thermonuclease family protein [bacterium]|nr:thermonuclease family protein [bacterium]
MNRLSGKSLRYWLSLLGCMLLLGLLSTSAVCAAEVQMEPVSPETLFRVVEIIDPSLLRLEYNGIDNVVRVIGIDIPGKPEAGAENWISTAMSMQFASQILEDGLVQIVADDEEHVSFDEDGNLLVHIMLPSAYNYAEELLYGGAVSLRSRDTFRSDYMEDYVKAEALARERHLGIWQRNPLDITGYADFLLRSDLSASDLQGFEILDDKQMPYGHTLLYGRDAQLELPNADPAPARLLVSTLDDAVVSSNFVVLWPEGLDDKADYANRVRRRLQEMLEQRYDSSLLDADESQQYGPELAISRVYADADGDWVWLRGFSDAVWLDVDDPLPAAAMVYYSTAEWQRLTDADAAAAVGEAVGNEL